MSTTIRSTLSHQLDQELTEAGDDLSSAGAHAAAALIDAGIATEKTVATAAHTVESAGHLVAAGALAGSGLVAKGVENVRSDLRAAADRTAHTLARAANTLGGDGIVRVREEPATSNAPRLSQQLLDGADRQAHEAKNTGEEALGDAVIAGAALYGVASNTVITAGERAASGAHASAAVDLEAAKLAVSGARQLAIAGARAAAHDANRVRNADEPRVRVDVSRR